MSGMSTNPLFLAGIISPPFDRNPAAALLLHGLVKLAKVIRESAHIALRGTKARVLGVTEDPLPMILNNREVHVHMPEGSFGKEDPSACTAPLSTFVSLSTKTPISLDIAKSENSLVGQALPVGKLKENVFMT